MGVSKDPNVGIAFALVCGAGGATALGASVVFFPSLVKLASRRVLASSLGISAGVMMYVSFVEIFQKSVSSFVDHGISEDDAFVYASACFFAGVVAMLLVDLLVRTFSGDRGGDHHHHHHHHHHGHSRGSQCSPHCVSAVPPHLDPDINRPQTGGLKVGDDDDEGDDDGPDKFTDEEEVVSPKYVGSSLDPAGELEEWQQKAEEETRMKEGRADTVASSVETTRREDGNRQSRVTSDDEDDDKTDEEVTPNVEVTIDAKQLEEKAKEQKRLVRMGLNTALAIGMHNFPEGLATFVATLADPKVGAVLAIAIGIHNIPEGLCVSLPIYYATGNRCQAFMWALVSGAAEPIAALLGWAVLANSFSDKLYAILFGLVAGMMVIISSKELMPTAHRYDPEDTVVTYSFIGGMLIMALSLVLFVV